MSPRQWFLVFACFIGFSLAYATNAHHINYNQNLSVWHMPELNALWFQWGSNGQFRVNHAATGQKVCSVYAQRQWWGFARWKGTTAPSTSSYGFWRWGRWGWWWGGAQPQINTWNGNRFTATTASPYYYFYNTGVQWADTVTCSRAPFDCRIRVQASQKRAAEKYHRETLGQAGYVYPSGRGMNGGPCSGTPQQVCRILEYDGLAGVQVSRWDSPGDNRVIVWTGNGFGVRWGGHCGGQWISGWPRSPRGIECWDYKQWHTQSGHTYSCNKDGSKCRYVIGNYLCREVQGPKHCMPNICQGVPANESYDCFLTNQGEYRKYNGTLCPFCPAGKISVIDPAAPEGFRCTDGARVVTPGTVASNQVILAACIGHADVAKVPGYSNRSQASHYKVHITKNGTNEVVFQKNASWHELISASGYKTSDDWIFLDNFSEGDYTVHCEVKYPIYPGDTFSATGTFTVNNQTGTSCEGLEIQDSEINKDQSINAKCIVRNAQDAKHSLTSLKETDKPSCFASLFQFGKEYGAVSTTTSTGGISNTCTSNIVGGKVRTTCRYTGSDQTVTIPAGVSQASIQVWWAAGGGSSVRPANVDPIPWGAWGFASGTLSVSGGQQYLVVVGEGGKRTGNATYGGGGAGGQSSRGASGWGLSGIFSNTSFSISTQAHAILVAGGGAGAGFGAEGPNDRWFGVAGAGGGTSGTTGSYGGRPWTQSSGGASYNPPGSSYGGWSAGNALSGGAGGNGNDGGGGGGSGYFWGAGGGGAAGNAMSGGGGSGYCSGSIAGCVLTAGSIWVPPEQSNPAYISGVGASQINADGGNGLIIFEWDDPNAGAASTTGAHDINNANCSPGFASKPTSNLSFYAHPETSTLNAFNQIQSFSENGEYSNVCFAHSEPGHFGFSAGEAQNLPAAGVTSASCGYPNTRKVLVGKSYCQAIQVPTNVFRNKPTTVTCELNTAQGTPTRYEILVDGAVQRSGTITAGASRIQEQLSIPSGTHTIACKIIGPENTDYINPNCSQIVIPEIEPSGICLPGEKLDHSTLCAGDDSGIGADVSTKVVNTCTLSRKCEYKCNNGYIAFNGKCVEEATYGAVTVPSHIRPGQDYPLVACVGNPNDQYFKYQIRRKTDINCPDGATGAYPNCVCGGSTTPVDISAISSTCTSTRISANKIRTTCNYTGSDQSIQVPDGAILAHIKAWWAGGGGSIAAADAGPENGLANGIGGGGGFTQGTISNPQGTYKIVVGESGKVSSTDATYGGGGPGGTGDYGPGSSGGGLTGLFRETYSQGNALIIAGGWGGSGRNAKSNNSGAGGGVSGEDAHNNPVNNYNIGNVAQWGSQSTGGAGASCSGLSGGNGAALVGGTGQNLGWGHGGGGWGAGYFGGGGWIGDNDTCTGVVNEDVTSSGAGGSGYCASTLQNCQLQSGSMDTPWGTSDSDYPANTAIGGPIRNEGGNGILIIEWTFSGSWETYNPSNNRCETNTTCPANATGTYPNCVCTWAGGANVELAGISNTCISTRISSSEIKTVCQYTGSNQFVQAPAGATEAEIKVWGAAGGSAVRPGDAFYTTNTAMGGAGAFVSKTIPANNFLVVVGQWGANTLDVPPGWVYPREYYGGGGDAPWGGTGGGLSGIFDANFTQSNAILIAGGGWGAANDPLNNNEAPDAGYPKGDDSMQGQCLGVHGDGGNIAGGGSQTAGGTAAAKISCGGTCRVTTNPENGAALEGGNANNASTYGTGGGGGAGYFGGGGGNGCYHESSGGGGSSYAKNGNATHIAGQNGVAPNTSDADYISGVAQSSDDRANRSGHGLIVIRWKATSTSGGQQHIYNPQANSCDTINICPGGAGSSGGEPIQDAGSLATMCHGKEISVGGCNGETSLTWQGKAYRLIDIGGQCWTSNMRHDADVGVSVYHPNNRTNTVEEEGKVYNKTAARNGDATANERVQWVCPDGYHLPSDCEFMALEAALGMSAEDQPKTYYQNRTFTALSLTDPASNWWFTYPGSYCNTNGWCGPRGQVERYLTSTGAMGRYFNHTNADADTFGRGWNETQSYYYASVRCLKDASVIDGSDFDAFADGNEVDTTNWGTISNGSSQGGGIYPNCSCPEGETYNLASNTCDPLPVCPVGSSGGNTIEWAYDLDVSCENNVISVGGCGGRTSISWQGETYRLIDVNGQCWTENMNHTTGVGTEWYLFNTPNEVEEGDGRSYNHTAVRNGYTGTDERYQGHCPDGFHVPSVCEFRALEAIWGDDFNTKLNEPEPGWDDHFLGGWYATNGWNNGAPRGVHGVYNTSTGNYGARLPSPDVDSFEYIGHLSQARYSWSSRCIADGTEILGKDFDAFADGNEVDTTSGDKVTHGSSGGGIYPNCSCPAGQEYDVATNTCTSLGCTCPAGETYDLASHTCQTTQTQVTLPAMCDDKDISLGSCGSQNTVAWEGENYRLIDIAGQCWTENMDHPSTVGSSQYFPGTSKADGEWLLYNSTGARDGDTTGERVQGICPDGFHVPSDCEWMAMESALGMSLTDLTKSGANDTRFIIPNVLRDTEPGWGPKYPGAYFNTWGWRHNGTYERYATSTEPYTRVVHFDDSTTSTYAPNNSTNYHPDSIQRHVYGTTYYMQSVRCIADGTPQKGRDISTITTTTNSTPDCGVDLASISNTCTSTQVSANEIKTVCTYTGSDQWVTVPLGYRNATIKMWGAAGGVTYGWHGGPGGFTSGNLIVNPGDSYTVVVGEWGHFEWVSDAYGFGWNAFHRLDPYNVAHSSGGGLSGLFSGTSTVAETDSLRAIIIAGGGGSGGGDSPRTSGGYGGSWNDTANCGDSTTMKGTFGTDRWGGGGWYEGGWAQSRNTTHRAQGEGGCGYGSSSITGLNIEFTPEFARIPPRTSDQDYIAGIWRNDDKSNGSGGNGLVVIRWTK